MAGGFEGIIDSISKVYTGVGGILVSIGIIVFFIFLLRKRPQALSEIIGVGATLANGIVKLITGSLQLMSNAMGAGGRLFKNLSGELGKILRF